MSNFPEILVKTNKNKEHFIFTGKKMVGYFFNFEEKYLITKF